MDDKGKLGIPDLVSPTARGRFYVNWNEGSIQYRSRLLLPRRLGTFLGNTDAELAISISLRQPRRMKATILGTTKLLSIYQIFGVVAQVLEVYW